MADPKQLTGIARLLMQEKFLTEAESCALWDKSIEQKNSFISTLISTKTYSSLDLALYLSKKFNCPYFDLDAFDASSLPEKMDLKLITQGKILPLGKKGKMLYAAVSDPTNEAAASDLKFSVQASSFFLVVVEDDKLTNLINKTVESRDVSLSSKMNQDSSTGMGDIMSELDDDDSGSPENTQQDDTGEVDDAPIVKFLQKVLIDAINQGASDIHFEPYEKFYRIRLRQDGILFEYTQVPIAIKEKLASRIKVISKLDISEKRVPQDGRLKLKLNQNRAIDFRVSTLPTLFGEKIVMRILDPSSATLGIDALGYDPDQKENLLYSVKRPYGMVLVTGPTGSGKTVSLYTCLNILNSADVNLSTAEDPAEINLPGINQVNINDRAGLTFPAALKSFLRQDPDVIMVGEIRDIETADIAMKAALTGHLVLSTLHTNDAPSTLTRLLDMGVAPFNIASAIILITAQRLARRLCKNCKRIHTIDQQSLLDAGYKKEELATYGTEWNTYEPVGCDMCKNGYKGRVGIYQVMPITDEMREIILAKGTSIQVAAVAAKNGIKDLRKSGLEKVKQGLTSLEEVLGVTNE